MNAERLTQIIDALLPPPALNSWERDDLVERIGVLPREAQKEVLRQIPVIWPVSYALYFAFLDRVGLALSCLQTTQLSDWVNAILDVYESGGLHAAQGFMADVEQNFVCRLRGEGGLALAEVASRLSPYIRGLAGREMVIAPATTAATDTVTIWLPPEITGAGGTEEHFLLYKFAATFQWAVADCGTYRVGEEGGAAENGKEPWLAAFLSGFSDRKLAADLFILAESVRVTGMLRRSFAGLLRDVGPVLAEHAIARRRRQRAGGPAEFVENGIQWLLALTGGQDPYEFSASSDWVGGLEPLLKEGCSSMASVDAVRRLYRLCGEVSGAYEPVERLPFFGALKIEEAQTAILSRRAESRARFVEALAAFLAEKGRAPRYPEEIREREQGLHLDSDSSGLVMPQPGGAEDTGRERQTASEDGKEEGVSFIIIGDERLDLPASLQPLAREIRRDLGNIPGDYLVSAIGLAGAEGASGPALAGSDGGEASGRFVYDEWDYRRSGFRKNWCSLHEKSVVPVGGTFVETTLSKHRALRVQLRRQFELMRAEDRFLRRQKDGDDIDLDAVVETLADVRAGLAPSDRLFIRLTRAERNIAALFLVDMSSSTEGWVSAAIKESLILLCEALEVLGDRYAIYGFSGMRRLRADFYHVKGFSEAYCETVKGRIAAIAPQEYTRMGPAIRHATGILAETDAKLRLLVTLSDGKPEDYDDYKGAYAVEDTRHALIEAKTAGIHPFCITIDREAHDYIPHMYGEVNWVCIDNVAKLPRRIPEIYRNLTV